MDGAAHVGMMPAAPRMEHVALGDGQQLTT